MKLYKYNGTKIEPITASSPVVTLDTSGLETEISTDNQSRLFTCGVNLAHQLSSPFFLDVFIDNKLAVQVYLQSSIFLKTTAVGINIKLANNQTMKFAANEITQDDVLSVLMNYEVTLFVG